MVGVYYMLASCVSALLGGSYTAATYLRYHNRSLRRRRIKQGLQLGLRGQQNTAGGLAQVILERLSRFDQGLARNAQQADVEGDPGNYMQLANRLNKAGVGHITVAHARAWQRHCSVVSASICALLGFAVTPVAACVGAIAGFSLGWVSLSWALKQSSIARSAALEQHLSQAIEVLCLGLRSGLSFERSLGLYCENFPSTLSSEFIRAQQMWHTGLLTRETALRKLAELYDSQLLNRMIETIVRSLRFGSPLADSLDELAVQARRNHKAAIEEKVMKAPVKMMLPVGLLILPSMLLLVMGPIMLEVMTGF